MATNRWETPVDFLEMFRLGASKREDEAPDWIIQYEDEQGPILNIGAGEKHIFGANTLDFPEWDADKDRIPFADEYFATIYAIHFLEHVKDPVAVLRELQRVLRPGGVLNIVVPYYSSQIAYHDLDHKTFWCEDTWKHLFNNKYYIKDHDGWCFTIGANYIMGIAERNMMLFTQLIREEDNG